MTIDLFHAFLIGMGGGGEGVRHTPGYRDTSPLLRNIYKRPLTFPFFSLTMFPMFCFKKGHRCSDIPGALIVPLFRGVIGKTGGGNTFSLLRDERPLAVFVAQSIFLG